MTPAGHGTRRSASHHAPRTAPSNQGTATQARVDSWTWAVRLFKTRSAAADACRGGHVRVNGATAKPAQPVRPGDEVRIRAAGLERIVIVEQIITKRVSAAIAAQCLIIAARPRLPGR